METDKKRFLVFNHTDGIWASPFPMTRDESEAFVKDFPKRYEQQGYYLTASGKRIRPEDVDLEVVRCDEV